MTGVRTNQDRIRVLVVDDSVVMRRVISEILGEDDAIEVVGTAANGAIALGRAERLRPDVITLDVEMPEMDGLSALRQMRERGIESRVIMFSTLTAHGAAAALEALSLGASDCVTKPANAGSPEAARAALRGDLLPKIKQFVPKMGRIAGDSSGGAEGATGAATGVAGSRGVAPRGSDGNGVRAGLPGAGLSMGVPRLPTTRTPRLVAVGVSTGGPNALSVVVPELPAEFPLPVVIVQHMPPLFTRLLAERLQLRSQLEVREAQEGDEVRAGRVLIAPGDYHLRLVREGANVRVALDQGPMENSCRPAVDVMFRSARECYGGDVVAVVLTGMGQDGLAGAMQLHDSGAIVIAQDEATSVVWGMPGYVVKAGIAHQVLPIEQVSRKLMDCARTAWGRSI